MNFIRQISHLDLHLDGGPVDWELGRLYDVVEDGQSLFRVDGGGDD
jgi:hypothetical protein